MFLLLVYNGHWTTTHFPNETLTCSKSPGNGPTSVFFFSQTTWNVELSLLRQTSFLSLDTINMLVSDYFSSRVPQYSGNSGTPSLLLPSFPFSYFLSFSSLHFPSLLPFMHLFLLSFPSFLFLITLLPPSPSATLLFFKYHCQVQCQALDRPRQLMPNNSSAFIHSCIAKQLSTYSQLRSSSFPGLT